ncbi:MAG: iron-sulfur cluster assembly protein [Bacteroidota bacterium]|jgi:probable FeS assembly SUF system protein SufT
MIVNEKKESPITMDGTKDTVTVAPMRVVTDERVWETMKECYDPEIPVNIVDLGLVYEVKVEEELPGDANVYIRMTLTAPGCGMGPMIAADVKRRVQQIPGVTNVLVELVFDPIWNPDMMSEAAKLTLNMG